MNRDRDLLLTALIFIGFALMALLGALLVSCASAPPPRPEIPLEKPWTALDACTVTPNDVSCPHDSVAAAVEGCINLWGAVRTCRVDLEETKATGGIDKAELLGAVQRANAETAKAVSWGWVKGAIGLAVGALAAGLLAGLVR